MMKVRVPADVENV